MILPGGRQAYAWFASMCVAVLLVYCPPGLFLQDEVLHGLDFWSVHYHRMVFARAGLLAHGTLPGWYPRELFGTPFWSNMQAFPWIPTRLLLLPFDPARAFAIGVNVAALLSAAFTYAYARTIGWAPSVAALSGWTFACSGFFASRVLAGHLPLLEAYPALPALLFLVERLRRTDRRWLAGVTLGVATTCVVLAGHPQLPAYAVATALLYSAWMYRGVLRRRALAAIVLGIGCASFAWYPMLLLIRRSTRVLPLEKASNDVAFPFERLSAYFLPWNDGWPAVVQRLPQQPFQGFPSTGYFWDTVVYVGLLPWLAVVLLTLMLVRRWELPGPRGLFFAAVGGLSLLLALPVGEHLPTLLSGTYLRSPARLTYLTTFSLSLALGALLQHAVASNSPRALLRLVLIAGVGFHLFDEGRHARAFVSTRPVELLPMPVVESLLRTHVGDARVAIDPRLPLRFARSFDDVGFFDSIMLIRPYQALLALAGEPARSNHQVFSAALLPQKTLASLGVRFAIPASERSDLPIAAQGRLPVFYVPDPRPRASFHPLGTVSFAEEADVLAWLRTHRELSPHPILAGNAAAAAADLRDESPSSEPLLEYRRPSSDRIVLELDAPGSGWVRVLESWDPGWSARLDGRQVPLEPSDGFAMAVPVGSGRHRLELEFTTPGVRVGLLLSVLSVLLLVWAARSRHDLEIGAPRAPGGPVGEQEVGGRGAARPDEDLIREPARGDPDQQLIHGEQEASQLPVPEHQRKRRRDAANLLDAKSRIVQQAQNGAEREQTRVGSVQDSRLAVVELASQEEHQARHDECDVCRGEEEGSGTVVEAGAYPIDEILGIVQMLDDVEHHDVFELTEVESQRLVQILHHDPHARRLSRHVLVDHRDLTALPLQLRREAARARAEVDDTSAGRHGVQGDRVAAGISQLERIVGVVR